MRFSVPVLRWWLRASSGSSKFPWVLSRFYNGWVQVTTKHCDNNNPFLLHFLFIFHLLLILFFNLLLPLSLLHLLHSLLPFKSPFSIPCILSSLLSSSIIFFFSLFLPFHPYLLHSFFFFCPTSSSSSFIFSLFLVFLHFRLLISSFSTFSPLISFHFILLSRLFISYYSSTTWPFSTALFSPLPPSLFSPHLFLFIQIPKLSSVLFSQRFPLPFLPPVLCHLRLLHLWQLFWNVQDVSGV